MIDDILNDEINTYDLEEKVIYAIIEAHGLAQIIYYMNKYLETT